MSTKDPKFMDRVAEELLMDALDISLGPVLIAIQSCPVQSIRADMIAHAINKILDLQDPGPIPDIPRTKAVLVAEIPVLKPVAAWPFPEEGTPV